MKILVIEDDSYFLLNIQNLLRPYGIVDTATSVEAALVHLKDLKKSYDLVVIDLKLNGENVGIELLETSVKRGFFSIVLTSHDTGNTVKRAYELGCRHFLTKRQFQEHFTSIVEERQNELNLSAREHFFKKEFVTKHSPLIEDILALPKRMIGQRSLLIIGETGVGKGKLAGLVHQILKGEFKQFIGLNITSISEDVLASELFGHAKGAFTGAVSKYTGKIEQANEGTLFLDEIAMIPLSVQVKLLKVLEEKTFYPVGSSKLVKSSFQLISATCDDIFEMMKENQFRDDLFHRISNIVIKIPPLRKRKEDIPLLIDYYLELRPRKIILTPQALQLLIDYDWPGNVRELKNTIDDLVLIPQGIVHSVDLPEHIRDFRSIKTMSDNGLDLPQDHLSLIKEKGLKQYYQFLESTILKKIVDDCEGRRSKAIELLRIHSSTFYRMANKSNVKFID